MAAVKGYIEKIKYRNEDNGYSVLKRGGRREKNISSSAHFPTSVRARIEATGV